MPHGSYSVSAVIESTDHDQPPALEASAATEIGRLVCEKKFCAAARLYSERTGASLLESKLAIDRLAHRHGHAPISGCASYFVALLVLAAGGAAWGVAEFVATL